MKYEYKCNHCNSTEIVDKPIKESSRAEYCIKCKKEMNRVYSASSIKTSDGVK